MANKAAKIAIQASAAFATSPKDKRRAASELTSNNMQITPQMSDGPSSMMFIDLPL
jgi:hypothetical protein